MTACDSKKLNHIFISIKHVHRNQNVCTIFQDTINFVEIPNSTQVSSIQINYNAFLLSQLKCMYNFSDTF